MPRRGVLRRCAGVVSLVVAALALREVAHAGEPLAPAPAALPFCDDDAAPPRLPRPLDRAFCGEVVGFDGERIDLRWDWTSPDQLDDFEPFIPVRSTLSGEFAVIGGHLAADGTAGIRLRLAMLADLDLHVHATLRNPHDLGIVLAAPGSSDDAILCLVQDVLFTRFDAPAGNSHMINRLGGVASAQSGMLEFRYIARRRDPRLDPGEIVELKVGREGTETTFTIAPKRGDAATLKGRDSGSPLPSVTPGLYVSGGSADFGTLTISGKLDARWCSDHGVLPYIARDLLHPGNRWKPAERRTAETVERFANEGAGAAKAAKPVVTAEAVAAIVGDPAVPLVIRIRAAEALIDRGTASGSVAGLLAVLLDAKDQPTRVLAWQVLRPRLPWHFRYAVDAEPGARRDAAARIRAFLTERTTAEAAGKVFIDGTWCTPDEADAVRAAWDRAWEIRSPRIRLRTNLPRKQADRTFRALEAAYAALVRLAGREPPAANLPMSVLVFRDKRDFATFCGANGYADRATWGRFADIDRNVSLATHDPRTSDLTGGAGDALGQFAKQFLRHATGKAWPTWFDEGRAAWIGSSEYGTSRFDGTTLEVGLRGRGGPIQLLTIAATQGRLPPISDVVTQDPRTLDAAARRIWYAEAWALHAWMMDGAPESVRERFARWQSMMEHTPTTTTDADVIGRRAFLSLFERDLPAMDASFREWVSKL